MVKRGWDHFVDAEKAYHLGKIQDAFDGYQRAIKKITKDEKVDQLTPIPSQMVPVDFPLDALSTVWMNFAGFFKDTNLPITLTEETQPEAYKLLKAYYVGSKKEHPEFKGSPRARLILQGIQIKAGFTLGLMAWDKKDRATAAKRYKETLDLVDTIPEFRSVDQNAKHLERGIQQDVQGMRDNFAMLLRNDVINANLTAASKDAERRTTLSVPNVRYENNGTVAPNQSIMIASDACAKCGKRAVKLPRCQKCKKVHYCGADCQRAHWKQHKASCVAATA